MRVAAVVELVSRCPERDHLGEGFFVCFFGSTRISLNHCFVSTETTQITEPTIDARIENKIARNREKHELNVERQLAAPPVDAVIVFVRIQHYVRHILASYAHLLHFQPQRHAELCSIASVGIAFFYEIVNGMSEFADAFPPANELLGDVLAQLGTLIRDNQSGEGVRLLETALRRPHLLQLLADMFTPSATAPVYFLDMYQFVVDSHMQKRDVKILFVLLSKVRVFWHSVGLFKMSILHSSRNRFVSRLKSSLMLPSGWSPLCRNWSTLRAY